jgi:predicted RNase H-like nuclease (RuvC/YqgF family)
MFHSTELADRPQTRGVKLTRAQLEGRKEKAVRFVRDVLGDPGRAGEIADESVEDYATRRKFEITNPRRRPIMGRTKTIQDYKDQVADLKGEISELEEENEALAGQLDEIANIVAPEEEEEEEEQDSD